MKDIRAILRNRVERLRYNRWLGSVLGEYLNEKTGIRVLDVGCGKNIISRKPYVLGCDYYPDAKNIVGAAADRLPFEDETFDIVVSAHCLEHVTDVKRVIAEWARVVKKDGCLWFILPHAERTFDQRRDLTTTEHIQRDYDSCVSDNDRTHWAEFRDKTLLSGHKAIPSHYVAKAEKDDFDFFSSQKLIHHHVWNSKTFSGLIECLGFQLVMCIDEVPGRSDSFSVLVHKPS